MQQGEKKQVTQSQYENTPLKIRQEIGNYAENHETKTAIYVLNLREAFSQKNNSKCLERKSF